VLTSVLSSWLLGSASLLGGGDVLRVDEPWEGVVDDTAEVVSTPALLEGGYIGAATVVGVSIPLDPAAEGLHHLDLRSYAFDGYLVLRGADGQVLAEDDDAGTGVHARLMVELDPGRPFVVQACALAGARGGFTLTLTPGPPPDLSPGEELAREIVDAELRLEEQLTRLGEQPADVATTRSGLATLLQQQGDYGRAREHLEAVLAFHEAALGPDHEKVGVVLVQLGEILREQALYADAISLFRRARTIFEDWYHAEHVNVAACLNSEALALQQDGRHAEALPLLERALGLYEQALGPEHPFVATLVGNVAQLLQEQGQVDRAVELHQRAVELIEAARGPQSLELALMLNDLATALQIQGQAAEALAGYERAHAILLMHLGPSHPMVASALNNQGSARDDLGDGDGARRLFEEAIAIREEVLGPAHPLLGEALSNLARIMKLQGELDEARRLMDRALLILDASLGPDHRNTSQLRNNLATVMLSQGDGPAARRLLEEALDRLEATLPHDHLALASPLSNLGAFLVELGDYDAARPRLERALALYRTAYGPDHVESIRVLRLLAWLAWERRDLEQADALYTEVLQRGEALRGPDHPSLASALRGLASLRIEAGESRAAIGLLDRAIALRIAEGGQEHRLLAGDLMRKGEAHMTLGELEQAKPLLQRALELQVNTLGEEHPFTVGVRTALSRLLCDLGRPEEVWPLVTRAATIERESLWRQLPALSEGELHLKLESSRRMLELLCSPACWPEGRDAPTEAYEALLAWKGQALRVASGRARQGLLSEGASLATLQRLRRLQDLLAQAVFRSDGELAGDVEALVDERARLERELASAAPVTLSTMRWSELAAAVPAGAALVDLFVQRVRPGPGDPDPARGYQPRLIAWITRRDAEAPVYVDLGLASEMEGLLEQRLTVALATRGRSPRAGPSPGRELRARLWDPLVPHLADVDTVFVSPDGVLAQLPWEILQDAEGRYLVEQRGFVYLTDPSLLVVRSSQPPRDTGGTLLVVGDVDYGPVDGGAERVGERGPFGGPWDPLQATADEARQVADAHARRFPDGEQRVLGGAAADEQTITAELPGASVVHLATHGFSRADDGVLAAVRDGVAPDDLDRETLARRLDDHHPGLLSGLVCAGANLETTGGGEDGYLTAEELGWIDLSHCSLAVLSACETGLGRVRSGEGLMGLRRSLLMAGADTVVSSLWSVGDRSTAELMTRFYRNLWERGMPRHEALRTAQLEWLEALRAEGRGHDVAAWGAFVLDGDWR
jgi:CHAT domain-containing protein/tetratricopeptide (TPR) repeat protein